MWTHSCPISPLNSQEEKFLMEANIRLARIIALLQYQINPFSPWQTFHALEEQVPKVMEMTAWGQHQAQQQRAICRLHVLMPQVLSPSRGSQVSPAHSSSIKNWNLPIWKETGVTWGWALQQLANVKTAPEIVLSLDREGHFLLSYRNKWVLLSLLRH